MRKVILLCLLKMFSENVNAQAINVAWAKGFGGLNSESTKSVMSDSVGNVFTVGYFQGIVDVDPGAGFFNLTSAGQQDIFITKLNENGMLVWARRIGGVGNESGNSICIDAAGNIYVTGFYHGMVDFDPGVGISHLIAATSFSQDIFILKLDSLGDFLWAKSFGGSGYYDSLGNQYDAVSHGYALKISSSGDVMATGAFLGSIDFDPSGNDYTLAALSVPNVFILKLSSNGDFIWAKQIGENRVGDEAYAIEVDSSANVYIAGIFSDTVDFDPGPLNYNVTSDSSTAAFVLKLNSMGQFVWVRTVHGTGSNSVSVASCIRLDQWQNILIGGYFKGMMDADPGIGNSILNSTGSSDIFVLKLSGTGDYLWAKEMGGLSSDYCYGITVDIQSNVYLCGSFRSSVDFDPGIDTFMLSSFTPNNPDAYILSLNVNGNFNWAYRFGGTGVDICNAIIMSQLGEIFICGSFANQMNFNAGMSSVNLLSIGGQDAFVLKLFQSQFSLPLSVLAFKAEQKDLYHLLQWKLGSLNRLATLEVEHADNALVFQCLESVEYLEGMNHEISNKFINWFPVQGMNYYRLKLIDVFGYTNYSKVISLCNELVPSKILISPNPTQSNILIDFREQVKNVNVKLHNLQGQLVYNAYLSSGDKLDIDLSSLPSGEYLITLKSRQWKEQQKIVLNR